MTDDEYNKFEVRMTLDEELKIEVNNVPSNIVKRFELKNRYFNEVPIFSNEIVITVNE